MLKTLFRVLIAGLLILPVGLLSQVDEIGVYYQQNGKWMEIPPEVVNWQTGGVLKHLASAGFVHGDINGRIRKPLSKTSVVVPNELLVYAPDGVAVSEYQLIHLHLHPDSREFRTVTGGIFHVSGGAGRDTLDFESQHVGKRTFRIFLGNLEPGEYGLLPPGLSMSNSAAAQLGKMYTFTVTATVKTPAAATGATVEQSGIRKILELQKEHR
jgi:hypothetical protein